MQVEGGRTKMNGNKSKNTGGAGDEVRECTNEPKTSPKGCRGAYAKASVD